MDSEIAARALAATGIWGEPYLWASAAAAMREALAGGKLTPEQKFRVERVLATTQPARPEQIQMRRGATAN